MSVLIHEDMFDLFHHLNTQGRLDGTVSGRIQKSIDL